MIDTIRASAQINITWFDLLKGWRNGQNNGARFLKKTIYLENSASVYMEYYLTGYLVIQFSASGVLNGTNAIPYNFDEYRVVEEKIASALADELYVGLDMGDFNICRIDLNRDVVCNDEETAEEVMTFAEKILPVGYEERCGYETGITSQTKKGNGLRVYRKDKDEHIPKRERKAMSPTVRFEFQMNRRKAERFFGFRPTVRQVLRNRILIERAWNMLLSKYALNKKIIKRANLSRFAEKTLTTTQYETLQKMNDKPTFEDKKQRARQLSVIRIFKKLGLCPYSCEAPPVMSVNVCRLILINNKRRKTNNASTYLNYIKPHKYHMPAKARWYLDTS